ncbi:MAG: DUF368 domain-containing protein [Candidatus Woesearchaeota archaeon]
MLFLKGLLMGFSDIIPGVSGGTMALVLGVYERLMKALGNINLRFIISLVSYFRTKKRRYLHDAKKSFFSMDPYFLILLGSGIFAAIIAGSFFIPFLMERFPSLMFAFFSGLIIGSIVTISYKRKCNVDSFAAGLAGFAAGFFVTSLEWLIASHNLGIIFLSGFLAVCAMLLPGVSGSFVLLMLGQYDFMLTALHEIRFPVVLMFIAGGILALVSMSRIISYFLKRFHDQTLFFLVGLMAGSVRILISNIDLSLGVIFIGVVGVLMVIVLHRL